MTKTLAIDFDGVLHDFAHPVAGRRMGEPMPGTAEALRALRRAGYRLIVHTVRGDSPGHIQDWCRYYGLKVDEVTNVKPNADWYIDDRAMFFSGWPAVLEQLNVK